MFLCGSYDALTVEADTVYCDPPYRNTTSVGVQIPFDSDKFWKWAEEYSCRRMFVSERACPDNKRWKCIFERKLNDGLGKSKLTERLFERI